MDAHRVNVLHITNRDYIACAVAHHLVLDFLPSGDAALHQHLSHTGKAQSVFQYFSALFRIGGNTAAGTAQSVCGTEHYRIADFFGNLQTMLYILHNIRGCHRLTDFLHGLLEHLAVLGLLDGQGRGADQAHIVFFKETCILQLHGQVKTCLSAQGGQHAVRFLF